MSIKKTCCFTGHRDIPQEKLPYIRARIAAEIKAAIADGYTHFISGFAAGADLVFADIVLGMRDEGKEITLEAAIPYRNRMNSKDAHFRSLLAKCNVVGVVSEGYSKDCFFVRNREMVQNSSRVIAVYDGRAAGGAFFTVRYARVMERELRVIDGW